MVAQETQSSSSSSCTVVVPTSAAATARGLDGRSGPRQRDGPVGGLGGVGFFFFWGGGGFG